jgi:DNA-binding NarL/FixJ family response regulator
MPTSLKIFLVDDHPLIRHGLRGILERQPNMEVVGESGDGQRATELVPRAKPDIVILDIAMPGIDGVQTARLLKRMCPTTKLIALTVHDEPLYMRQMFEAGAAGYVLKRSSADELLHAIRTVAGSGIYVDPRLAGGLVSDLLRLNGDPAPRLSKLTDREERVLKQIAAGYSNKEIAAELSLSVKTVETYKARAMDKLGLNDRVAIVRHAVRCGWLARDDGGN